MEGGAQGFKTNSVFISIYDMIYFLLGHCRFLYRCVCVGGGESFFIQIKKKVFFNTCVGGVRSRPIFHFVTSPIFHFFCTIFTHHPQASPHKYFSLNPACGTVAAGSEVSVIVNFIPRPYSKEVGGGWVELEVIYYCKVGEAHRMLFAPSWKVGRQMLGLG